MHCVATVVLRKQLNFKSAVIRSNRSSCFFFVGDQTQTSARPNFESRNEWCLFAKSCWNINTRTILRILFSLLWVKYSFFWFYRSVGFKWNNKHAKKGITSAMECANITAFTFPRWQIRWCLLYKVISVETTVINLFAVLLVFLVVLGKWSKFFGYFIAATS